MKSSEIKGVFFDFDDTLQSRKGAYKIYCENFLSKYFPNLSKKERDEKLFDMENLVDGGYKEREVYFPELIEKWNWTDHPPLLELCDSFNNEYGKNVDLYDGAVDVLLTLKKRGYILGAVTNGNSTLQNMKLDTANIRQLFDTVVVSDDIKIRKPDKRIFEFAAKNVGLLPCEIVFVGDHPKNDIDGALSANMKAIRINKGDFFNKGLNKPVLATITEITEVLNYL